MQLEGGLVIKTLSLGGYHSFMLDQRGKVWCCGSSSSGQTGLRRNKNVGVPTLVRYLRKKKVLQIACGWNHTLILVDPNNVYSCGLNKYGQLGLCDFESKLEFTYVETLKGKNVTNIYAGGDHSWFLIDSQNPDVQIQEPSNLDFSDEDSGEKPDFPSRTRQLVGEGSLRDNRSRSRSAIDDADLYLKPGSKSRSHSREQFGPRDRRKFPKETSSAVDATDKPTRLFPPKNPDLVDSSSLVQSKRFNQREDQLLQTQSNKDGQPNRNIFDEQDGPSYSRLPKNLKKSRTVEDPDLLPLPPMKKGNIFNPDSGKKPLDIDREFDRFITNNQPAPSYPPGRKDKRAKRNERDEDRDVDGDSDLFRKDDSPDSPDSSRRDGSERDSPKGDSPRMPVDDLDLSSDGKRNDDPRGPRKGGRTSPPKKDKPRRGRDDSEDSSGNSPPGRPERPRKKPDPESPRLPHKDHDSSDSEKSSDPDNRREPPPGRRGRDGKDKRPLSSSDSSEREPRDGGRNAKGRVSGSEISSIPPANQGPNRNGRGDSLKDDSLNNPLSKFGKQIVSEEHLPNKILPGRSGDADRPFPPTDPRSVPGSPFEPGSLPKLVPWNTNQLDSLPQNPSGLQQKYATVTDLKPPAGGTDNKFFEIDERKRPNDPSTPGDMQRYFPRKIGDITSGLRSETPARGVKWDFHLIFTDLECSHRFVIFKCLRKNKARVHDILQNLLRVYSREDPKLVESNLVMDNEFYEENDAGRKSSAVCDFDSEICEMNLMTINQSSIYGELIRRTAVSGTAYEVLRKTGTSIGNLYLLSEDELLQHERWKNLAYWYFEFKAQLVNWVFDPLFYELRPLKHM